uniref:Oxidoreductase n=1 Tax=Ascaris suum TaxID=6253 RepID=F1L8E3_ASCSU
MTPVPLSVLITGANRGIGLGLVKQWASLAGVKHIFACARKPDAAEELKDLSRNDARIHCVKLDVNSDKSILDAKKQVDLLLDEGTGLNVLINNAGCMIAEGGTLENADRSVYLQHFDTNVISVAKMIEAFLPLLKMASKECISDEWGVHRAAIINISSELGSIESNNTGSKLIRSIPYRLSKAALNQLTKTLSVDLAEDSILVVSVCPGWVRTDMGGPEASLTVEQSTKTQIQTALSLRKEHSGLLLSYDGTKLAY